MSHEMPRENANLIWAQADLVNHGIGSSLGASYFGSGRYYEIYYETGNLVLQEWELNASEWIRFGSSFSASSSNASIPDYSPSSSAYGDAIFSLFGNMYTPNHVNYNISGNVYNLSTSSHYVSEDGPYLVSGGNAYSADVDDDGNIGDVSVFSEMMFSSYNSLGQSIGTFDNGTYTANSEGSEGSEGSQGSQGNQGIVGNQGNVGSQENTQPSLTSGSDRVQINVATSTSALSGLIDAAEGLDSLHLDGLFASTTSSEDLKLDGMDPKITSQMISTNGGGYFDLNNNYAEINLPSGLSGEVHVWTQTPEFYN